MNSRRGRLLLFAALTLAAGLALRLLPTHLSFPVTKYDGSALWAMLVFYLLAALFPSLPPLRVALIAGTVALLVELSRLHHTPAEDAFRLTLAGRLLLDRVFSIWNIATYWIAIALAALLDQRRK